MALGIGTTPDQATEQMQQAAQDSQQQAQQSAPLVQQAQGASDDGSTSDDQKNSSAAPQQEPQGQQQASQPPQDQKTDYPNGQPGLPKNPQAPQQTTAAKNDPQTHPAVQKANLVHDIALALAGGPHFTTSIDPNTGTTTRTQVPVSGKQIAMAIAMEALGGGIAGLGAKGPNNEGQALQAGFSQGAQQQKQAQAAEQQQAQQASSDYARQAAITSTNFTTHQNAMRLGQMEYDQHKQYVSDAKPVLDNLQQVGAVKASNIREGDLLDKYHVTKDMAVVDGIVPRMNPDGSQATNKDGSKAWDNTYSIIDPDAKIGLPDATAKFLADHHVQGYFRMVDGKATPINLPDSQQLKARIVVDGLATASAIRISESALNQQLGKLADGADEQKKFQVSLTDGLESGSVTPKALKTYAQFSNVPIDQLRAQMEKAKVDTDTIGQIMSVIPKDAIDESAKQRVIDTSDLKSEEARKNLVVSKTNYDSVLGAPKGQYSDAQVSAAQAIDKQVRHEKSQDAYNTGRNGEQGRIDAKVANGIPLVKPAAGSKSDAEENLTHPELASLLQDEKNYNTPNGTNEAFMQGLMKLDPERARMIQALDKGFDIQSYYAAAKKFGGSINADLHAYDPSFNSSLIHQYEKTQIALAPNGAIGKTNAAASTLMEHLGKMHDLVGTPGYWAANGRYDVTRTKAIEEMANMYANGNKPGENELKETRGSLSSRNPFAAGPAIIQSAKLAMDKIRENYNIYDQSLPRGMKRQAPMSEDAAAAYTKMTGDKVDPDLINHQMKSRAYTDGTSPHHQQASQPALLTGQRQGEAPVVHNGQVVGYTMQGKNGMRPVTPFAAH